MCSQTNLIVNALHVIVYNDKPDCFKKWHTIEIMKQLVNSAFDYAAYN